MLDELLQPDSSFDVLTAGDPFMFGQQHENLTEHAVARLFGKNFASDIFSLSLGPWQGPLQSGYGLHLVQIGSKTPASLPSLDAVRDKVFNEWQTQQRRTMNEAFYKNLRQRYKISIESISNKDNVAKTPLVKAEQ